MNELDQGVVIASNMASNGANCDDVLSGEDDVINSVVLVEPETSQNVRKVLKVYSEHISLRFLGFSYSNSNGTFQNKTGTIQR